MSEAYSIKVGAVADNTQAVLELWRNGFADLHGAAASAKLAQSYLDNPAGPGVFFFLESTEVPGFIGVQSLVQRIFHHRNQVLMAGIMADYVVDARHRSLGPALLLLQSSSACGRENFGFIYGMPNKKAQPVLKRAGLTPLGMMVRYSKPLHSRPFLSSRVAARWVPWVAPLVDVGVSALDFLRSLKIRQPLAWTEVGGDDPALDVLWERGDKKSLTLAERSRRLLAWRYPEAGGWRIVVARRKRADDVVGYVVYRQRNDVVVISDFFCLSPLDQTGDLLLEFSRSMRRQRISSLSLEFFGADAVTRGLHQAGFAAREHNPIFAVRGDSAGFDDKELWYFTGFDRDTD